jgi:predicted phage terminase large subunit-like protein
VSKTVEVNLTLHPGQQKVFDSDARFIVCVAGRRFGKSWLACVRAITSALDERNVMKAPVFLIAPTYPSARTIYWRRLHGMAGGLVVNSNVNLGIVELANGVEIQIKGADRPDTLRGVGLWDCVIDEYADQKPEIWELIIRPALADSAMYGGGRCMFIGTPKGRNHFYGVAQQAAENATGEWELFQFSSAENPFIPESEIAAASKTLSSAAFRQEFMASFESSGGAVFQRKWLKTGVEPKDGRWYIAVDLAGFADVEKSQQVKSVRLDQTAIAVVKVDAARWFIEDIIAGRWGIKETADRIALLTKKYQPAALGVERGALHKAVEPFLRERMQHHGAMTPIVELTHGNKAKIDRITWALQGRFEHGMVTMREGAPWLSDLEDQLLQFPSKTTHDDMADALSYIDQLAQEAVWTGYEDNEDPWTPLDADTGY